MEKIPCFHPRITGQPLSFSRPCEFKRGRLKDHPCRDRQVKRGVSVWIFRGEREIKMTIRWILCHLKRAQKIAEKSGCYVVPVALTGTAEVFEQHFPKIKPSHVTITFGERFHTKGTSAGSEKIPGRLYRRTDKGHAYASAGRRTGFMRYIRFTGNQKTTG